MSIHLLHIVFLPIIDVNTMLSSGPGLPARKEPMLPLSATLSKLQMNVPRGNPGSLLLYFCCMVYLPRHPKGVNKRLMANC